MPRKKINPSRLSKAWKTLYKLENYPLDEKVEYSKSLIIEALDNSKNPTISWSGGKDSTVVLHLIKEIYPSIPIIFVDMDTLFPETKKYVYDLASSWKLNLYIEKPIENTFESITEKYGYPIFSKNIASNVERAIRTGNIRKQLSKFELLLVKHKAKISTKCSQYLLEKPCKNKEKELTCDLKFIGLRAFESRARVRLWADYGDYYSVKEYYGKKKPILKCNPIAAWTEADIWNYFKRYNIPICDIYNKGYQRNGCWSCAMAIRNGQLKRLKNYNPNLYNHLIYNTNMGKEILRLRDILKNENGFKNYINLPK
ncbi:MAG: phosphoadenosine phosphosulfate reductase family protein [Candidatus Woesearchaeota archaeon]